jgi:hypothetical protein
MSAPHAAQRCPVTQASSGISIVVMVAQTGQVSLAVVTIAIFAPFACT